MAEAYIFRERNGLYFRDNGLTKEVVKSNGDNQGFWEYPGSVKGDGGWWRVTEWLEYKVDQSLKRKGERV